MSVRIGAVTLLAAVVAGSLGAGAAAPPRQAPPAATITAAGWLAGSWVGAGAATFEEHWTAPAGGAMLATSRTVRNGRMVAFEFLRIVERDGTLVYIAQPQGRPPTEFVLTAIDETSVTFGNPAHDFPKVIRYARRGADGLEATVSDGGSKAQRFSFTRAPLK